MIGRMIIIDVIRPKRDARFAFMVSLSSFYNLGNKISVETKMSIMNIFNYYLAVKLFMLSWITN